MTLKFFPCLGRGQGNAADNNLDCSYLRFPRNRSHCTAGLLAGAGGLVQGAGGA